MKACAWCERTEEEGAEFGHNRNEADGKQKVCKDCLAENWRKNHNIDQAPPVPRRGPYAVFAEKLDLIEQAARAELAFDVVDVIEGVRADLKL